MNSWMQRLAQHYEQTRRDHPDRNLIILFDIDGTILDMRHMVRYVLQEFDREHGSEHFRQLRIEDIDFHENHIEPLLQRLHLAPKHQERVLNWYEQNRYSAAAVLESHRPFRGVLEVIRWFQMQPRTFVGLNSGRPERRRIETLHSLNQLGWEYRVQFPDELVHLNPRDWGQAVQESKCQGIQGFRERGYHVFAFVDNEPDNLEAVARINDDSGILLLHADTIFESQRSQVPAEAASGNNYDLTELVCQKALPQHVQFVWHGVNDEANLRQFLGSNIHWAEFDVRRDPVTRRLVLREDPFEQRPADLYEEILELEDVLAQFEEKGVGVKLDLKEADEMIDSVLEALDDHHFSDFQIWFNGNIERLQEEGFRKLAERHPDAIIQCPIDFLVPLIQSAPKNAQSVLTMLRDWGINRFSVSWRTPGKRQVFDQLEEWGYGINVHDVPDLESFLQAVLLMPRSITSDFNFPKWHYFGRGPGAGDSRHSYVEG
jgi:hypothetical protein